MIRINNNIKGMYTVEDIKLMMNACDENKNGTIELDEFSKAIIG